jgi:hypothetical protein
MTTAKTLIPSKLWKTQEFCGRKVLRNIRDRFFGYPRALWRWVLRWRASRLWETPWRHPTFTEAHLIFAPLCVVLG